MDEVISRQAAIDVAIEAADDWDGGCSKERERFIRDALEELPSARPEPAIPLQWIEAQIEWLKSLDNAFSDLTAGQISAMVNKWKDEQDASRNDAVEKRGQLQKMFNGGKP